MHDQSKGSETCSELFMSFETRHCTSIRFFVENKKSHFLKCIVEGRKKSYLSQFTIKMILISVKGSNITWLSFGC